MARVAEQLALIVAPPLYTRILIDNAKLCCDDGCYTRSAEPTPRVWHLVVPEGLIVMHIDVDLALCEGHGLCEQTAPDVYELDDEGQVRLSHDELDDSQAAAAEAGARVCPVRALTVHR